LTRSGVVSSVHTFQPEATLENILSIFIPSDSFLMSIILRFIPDERMFFLLIVLIGTFVVINFYSLSSKEKAKLPLALYRKDFQASRARTTALKISYLSFLCGTFLIFLGLIAPIIYDIIGYIFYLSPTGFGSTINVGSAYYNTIAAIFGGIMLIAQFFCTFFPRLAFKRKVNIVGASVVFSAGWALTGFLYQNDFFTELLPNNPFLKILGNFWTTNDIVNFIVPLLIIGIVGLGTQFIRVVLQEEKNFFRKSSQTMLHLSFLVILLGALLSANMTVTSSFYVQEGRTYDLAGTSLSISILNIRTNSPETGLHVVQYDTELVVLDSDVNVVGFGVSRLAFDNTNRRDSKVTIISSMLADIYIVTVGNPNDDWNVDPFTGRVDSLPLQVKVIPYINILWTGCLFLHFAIIPLVIWRFIETKQVFSYTEPPETKTIAETIASSSP
jgi:cytochrome c biogenesis factor